MAETTQLPDKRIADACEARSLYKTLRSNSITRRSKWAQVQNQLDGGSPFSNHELVKNGQGWRCNVNFRDASSTLEQVLVSYWRLLHDTPNLAAVTVHGENPNSDRDENLFQENFSRFHDDWGAEYVQNYLQFSQNHVGFGVGLCHFGSDTDCPRWEPVRIGDIEVPDKAKNSIDKNELVFIRQELTLSELWEKIREEDEETSSAAGWDVGAVKELITRALKGDASISITSQDMMDMQERMRNNSLSVSTKHGPLSVIHVLVKEFDSKISCYIFAEQMEQELFLYDNSTVQDRPEKMSQALAAVFFEAGNGKFHGTQGFGVKNFPIATMMNRLKSRAVDRTLLDGLNFKDMSDGSRQTIPITNVGPYNFLPKDVEQLPSYPSGRSILETIEMLDRQYGMNTARYRDQGRQVADTNTATQANILATIQSNVDISNATLYLKQVAQNIFCEQFRRLRKRDNRDEDAVNFKKRCVEEGGMDEKVFHDVEISVRTGADPGSMNMAMQGDAALQVMQLPDSNRRWAQERFVASKFGAQAVKKALNPVDQTSDVASQRLAILENDAMGHGSQVPVDDQDNHAAHLPVHLQPLMVIADAYKQRGTINPDQIIALQNAIPHAAQHFEFLKQDKTQEKLYKQMWPIFTQVSSFAEGIFRQLEKMQAGADQGQFSQGQPGQSQPGGFSPAATVGAVTPQG